MATWTAVASNEWTALRIDPELVYETDVTHNGVFRYSAVVRTEEVVGWRFGEMKIGHVFVTAVTADGEFSGWVPAGMIE